MQKKILINGKFLLTVEEIILELMQLEFAKKMEDSGAGELL